MHKHQKEWFLEDSWTAVMKKWHSVIDVCGGAETSAQTIFNQAASDTLDQSEALVVSGAEKPIVCKWRLMLI